MNDPQEPTYDMATGAEDFSLVHHNPTDFSAFRDFQAQLEEKFSKVEAERSRASRIANVKRWDASLPPKWRGGSLKTIENDAARAAEKLIQEHRLGSFFIKGKPSAGKTYLSYAIARRFIGLGYITPSNIKTVSEESLLSIPKSGFAGQARFEELFESAVKFYIFDNVGTRSSLEKREASLWEQLLDHIYTKDLAAIFTSTSSAASFAEKLSGPAEAKFNHLVDGKIITMKSNEFTAKLDDWSDDELEENVQTEQEVGLFNAFKE